MVAPALAVIALGLLGTAGIAKIVAPEPTSGALRSARLPSSPAAIRSLGVVEVAAALIGLLIGGLATLPAAGLYVGFAVFTLAAIRRRTPLQSCGCFGRDDTPPSVIHVVYNAAAALGLAWTALASLALIPWDARTVELILYLAFGTVGVYISYLLLTRLPQALNAGRPNEHPTG